MSPPPRPPKEAKTPAPKESAIDLAARYLTYKAQGKTEDSPIMLALKGRIERALAIVPAFTDELWDTAQERMKAKQAEQEAQELEALGITQPKPIVKKSPAPWSNPGAPKAYPANPLPIPHGDSGAGFLRFHSRLTFFPVVCPLESRTGHPVRSLPMLIQWHGHFLFMGVNRDCRRLD